MKSTRIVSVLTVSTALLIGSTAASHAAGVNPGEFEVTMDRSAAQANASMPECDPPMESIMAKVMTGTSVDVTCTMNTDTTMEMNGTVANQSMATEFGSEAFLSGTLQSTCDVIQAMEMKMTVSGMKPQLKSFKGNMFQNCAWKMSWADPKNTTLSGTMEMNGKAGNDDGSVDASGDVAIAMSMKMYITGGSGEYEGYVGTGEFSRSQTMSVMGGANAQAPDGGSSQIPSDASGQLPPGGSSGATPSAAQIAALCTAAGITPCDQQAAMAWCASNSTQCGTVMSSVRIASAMKRFARKTLAAAGSDGMSMNLVKAAGQVRIISPAPPAGQPKATAKVTAKSVVELVATQGAKCVVTNNKKKVVGSVTSKSSSAVLNVKPKAGAYSGAKSIRATCTIGGKKFTSNTVKVAL